MSRDEFEQRKFPWLQIGNDLNEPCHDNDWLDAVMLPNQTKKSRRIPRGDEVHRQFSMNMTNHSLIIGANIAAVIRKVRTTKVTVW